MSGPSAGSQGSWRARFGPQFAASRKKTIALLALLPVMIMVWIPVIRGKPRAQPQVPAADSSGAAEVAAAPAGESAPVAAPTVERDFTDVAQLGAEIARLRDDAAVSARWSTRLDQDPFRVSASGLSEVESSGPTVSDAERLAPTSIMLSEQRGDVARILGRACRVGDEIEGYVVIRIEERQVLLRNERTELSVAVPLPRLGGGHE